MYFSLVMATVNRTKKLEKFLEYLDKQTYRDFELIVVDQNADDRLDPILQLYHDRFSILHLRSAKRGASRARNVGLKHANGEIITFPDDDCWYPPDLLEGAHCFFEEHPEVHVLTARSVDDNMKHSHINWDLSEGFVNRFNMWKRVIEFSIFIRSETAKRVGDFDEFLGVGAGTLWGSGEGPDYILRALKAGFRIYYDPSVVIYHAQPVHRYDAKAVARARSYGGGIGAVLRRHKYPFWFVCYGWIRSTGGFFLCILLGRFGKARHYLAALQGKIAGWAVKMETAR